VLGWDDGERELGMDDGEKELGRVVLLR